MIDRTAWLEARRKGIGGTDAPAILGLSRWRTAVDVWQDKLGLSPERPQTAPMRWGLALEEAIARAYVEETGTRIRKVGMRRAKHVRDYPMIGSIDRMAYGDVPRVVELKTARSSDGWAGREEWPDLPPEKRVPPDYYVQVQHYLEVVEADVADVAVLFSGSDFRRIELPRDRDFGADLRVEEGNFWRDHVLTEIQPEVTAGDLDYLARKYPRSAEEEKIATPEIAELVDEILALDDRKKDLETRRDALRAKVEDYLGEAAKLLTPRGTVSWKTQERNTVGWKELAGSLERMVVELESFLEYDDMTGVVVGLERKGALSRDVVPYLPRIGSGYGPGLEGLRSLYSQRSEVRPFRVDRKKEGAK